MPQEGQSGKSQGSDEFQPARRLAASVAPAPPRRLTSELQLSPFHSSTTFPLCQKVGGRFRSTLHVSLAFDGCWPRSTQRAPLVFRLPSRRRYAPGVIPVGLRK